MSSEPAAMRALAFASYQPQWQVAHALRSTVRISQAFRESGECNDPILLADIELASMARDFYMDTPVTRDQIRADYGDRVDRMVEGLTNRQLPRPDYDALIAGLVEELRVIRLASTIENLHACTVRIAELGPRWVAQSILPIVTRWTNPPYERYRKTAQILEQDLAYHRDELISILAETPDQPDPTGRGLDDERTLRAQFLVRGMRAFASRVALPS